MSLWGNSIKRSKSSDIRKEDFALVYGEEVTIDRGEYRNYKYCINGGTYPIIFITGDLEISKWSGKILVYLHDRNGELKELNRFNDGSGNGVTMSCHYNNIETDYIKGHHNGKKYTLEELKDDVKAYIDDIISQQNEFVKNIK